MILAHHSPALLARLVSRLDDFGVSCFVHVDAKEEVESFRRECASSDAVFIENRIALNWGGFSIVSATLNLIEAAREQSQATHFVLMSGDSYPVSTGADFVRFFLSSPSIIEAKLIPPHEKVFQRVARLYLPDSRIGSFRSGTEDPSIGRYITGDLVDRLAEISQVFDMKLCGFPWRLAKGSQWWCLTRTALDACLETIGHQRDYLAWFRYSSVPDESFFQTMFLNFVAEPFINRPPVFTVWSRVPRPYIFREIVDLRLLETCKTVLARKFSGAHLDVLDELDAVHASKHRGG